MTLYTVKDPVALREAVVALCYAMGKTVNSGWSIASLSAIAERIVPPVPSTLREVQFGGYDDWYRWNDGALEARLGDAPTWSPQTYIHVDWLDALLDLKANPTMTPKPTTGVCALCNGTGYCTEHEAINEPRIITALHLLKDCGGFTTLYDAEERPAARIDDIIEAYNNKPITIDDAIALLVREGAKRVAKEHTASYWETQSDGCTRQVVVRGERAIILPTTGAAHE